MDVLERIGIADVERVRDGTKTRAGIGKMRGRRFRSPRGVRIVVSNEESPLLTGASNLPGVEIVTFDNLNAALMAPGGDPGRLALFSESALNKIGEW
ncbi:MAG: 50S ribosomal protein L4 [Methanomassiliicoccales archaeon]|nr:50S ribosomal protein L4 [Methanomassiliicoccales archaeon]